MSAHKIEISCKKRDFAQSNLEKENKKKKIFYKPSIFHLFLKIYDHLMQMPNPVNQNCPNLLNTYLNMAIESYILNFQRDIYVANSHNTIKIFETISEELRWHAWLI